MMQCQRLELGERRDRVRKLSEPVGCQGERPKRGLYFLELGWNLVGLET